MEPTSLLRKRTRAEGRGVGRFEWRGIGLRAVDDALAAIEIDALLGEPGGDEKMPALLRILFPGSLMSELRGALPPDLPAGELGDLAAQIAWEAFGIDLTSERVSEWEPPVFDFAEDAGRIRASLLIAYGMDWDEACTRISYAELCDLLSCLMESGCETPFREAVYYRTAEPPRDAKGAGEYRRAWLRRRAHFALRSAAPTADQIAQAHNDAMAGMFAAAERAAMANG